MLRVVLPNKGALAEGSAQLFREAGYRCSRRDGELLVYDDLHDIEFFFLRPRDIATYVGSGLLDIGVTGRDFVLDSEVPVFELQSLNFGRSELYFAVPQASPLTPDQFAGMRIATSFPRLLATHLAQLGITAQIICLDGAVEIAIQLGVADVVADVVESGKTLQQAGLKKVGSPIVASEAILIGRSQEILDRPQVKSLLARLKGIVIARKYAMLEYDLPEALLDEAIALTPGIESPTIARLYKEEWLAIKAMVERCDLNSLLDKLEALGAKGIIVTNIQNCRL